MSRALRNVYRRYSAMRERRYVRSLLPISEMTRVEKAPGVERGVFATKYISAGTLLGTYPGHRRSIHEFMEKGEFLDNSLRYAYYLNANTVIDPSDLFGYVPDTPALRLALINEPPPGATINVVSLASESNIWYACLRAVYPGEQLLTSYGKDFQRSYPCDLSMTKGAVPCDTKDLDQILHIGRSHPWLKDSALLLHKVSMEYQQAGTGKQKKDTLAKAA